MKRIILLLTVFVLSNSFDTEEIDSYAIGEFFKLRIHYGLINAGYATLEVKDAELNGKKMEEKCTMLLEKATQLG